MPEPEGQELQDKLVTIWYVMDQYQRDVEQWHDQKRKLKEKKGISGNEWNHKQSFHFCGCVVCSVLFAAGTFTRDFSSFL